jgi:hypothetical protein
LKIYTTTYSTQYNNIKFAKAPLFVPNGYLTCFKIPFPSEGFLERFIMSQATGTSCDFSVEILCSTIPYPPGNYVAGTLPVDALPFYRIQVPPTAPFLGTAGNILSMDDTNFGVGFRNIDGGWTANKRFIYLVISPTTPGSDTTWNVQIQCRTDIR